MTDPITTKDIEPPSAIDRTIHANMARLTCGISPASLMQAWSDWVTHLAMSPAKQVRLMGKTARKNARLMNFVRSAVIDPNTPPAIEPLPQDNRFKEDAWKQWPFNLYAQTFLLQQQWWHNATTGIEGVSQHHEDVVAFVARQLLDTLSPVNFALTNPLVQEATRKEFGMNLLRGWQNYLEDAQHAVSGKPPVGVEQFRPGHEVAITPGKVVYRNHLIELIQYTPSTPKVHAEPLLIVPAWIMKYYILDLSPNNSLVKYLIDQGHTVFMISWHNPDQSDRNLGMDDYLQLGVLDALKTIRKIIPDRKIDTLGYCLGGTLLAIAAAWLAREPDPMIHSVTLLAAQTDFTEAGELMLFIDDSQLSYLDDMMWEKGYLDTKQMAGAFQMLRSNDLIWSPLVQQYMLGKRAPMTDLMAWNADATRMPYRMHSSYLRSLFLNNELFEGRYEIAGRKIALGDIAVPLFVVATENDHVAPWRSVHKIKLAVDAPVTFLLTSGGHNAGIVSEPGHAHRHYCYDTSKYQDPDSWAQAVERHEGSWWPILTAWLAAQSGPEVKARAVGAVQHALCDAPGKYVKEI